MQSKPMPRQHTEGLVRSPCRGALEVARGEALKRSYIVGKLYMSRLMTRRATPLSHSFQLFESLGAHIASLPSKRSGRGILSNSPTRSGESRTKGEQ